ncbi:MAG: hypothetical protein LUF85_02265 [Bacteroides sp.]|nr:hypothetical protein [Bacteroides sp.]
MAGEIKDITELPLSRNGSDDLYGIQIYTALPESDTYAPYAYGLFDDLTGLTVKLLEGNKYKFVATMVVDGKNRLYSYENLYAEPFATSKSNTPILPDFQYSSNIHMYNISFGSAFLSTAHYMSPNLDRFYGVVRDYIPVEDGTVTIEMIRTAFGLKIIAEGLEEGMLEVNVENSPPMQIRHPETEIKEIISFYGIHSGYEYLYDNQTDYSEDYLVSITWKKDDNTALPIANQTLTFKRNKLYVVTVEIDDSAMENGMDIHIDDDELEEEHITIKPGEGIDMGVEPEQM